MLVFIIPQVANPANITNLVKGEIIKTTPFEIVLIIRDSYERVNILLDSKNFLGILFFSGLWKDVGWNSVLFSAAYALTRKNLYRRKFIARFLDLPSYISAGIIPVYILYRYLGLINNYMV